MQPRRSNRNIEKASREAASQGKTLRIRIRQPHSRPLSQRAPLRLTGVDISPMSSAVTLECANHLASPFRSLTWGMPAESDGPFALETALCQQGRSSYSLVPSSSAYCSISEPGWAIRQTPWNTADHQRRKNERRHVWDGCLAARPMQERRVNLTLTTPRLVRVGV